MTFANGRLRRLMTRCGVLLSAVMWTLLAAPDPAFAQKPKETKVNWRAPESRWEQSWLTTFYGQDFAALTDKSIDWAAPPFETAILDLDGKQGNPAIFVAWSHPRYCDASNCQVDVWYWDAPDNLAEGTYRIVLRGAFRGDFVAGPGLREGMRDIWIGDTRFRWNGEAYVP